LEVTMRPGDVLYLPPKAPHAAAAQDDPSLHLTLSVEPRRWRDLVHECVDALMDQRYDGFPYLGRGTEAGSVTGLAQRISELAEDLSKLDPETELTRLASTGRARAGSTASQGFSPRP
jgi:lysine-specific demethylase/histidyl-hydroxylase NO66